MILDLRFSNYYSFHEPVHISFETGRKPGPSYYDVVLDDDRRLNKVSAVVGANGSGKTQLLRPLTFLSWFVDRSFLKTRPDDPLPLRPHALHPQEPTRIELRFLLAGQEYKYQLVTLDNRVELEALYRKTSQQYSYIFVRERQADDRYSVKRKDFPFKKNEAEKVKSNASLLSAAHVYGVEEAKPFQSFFQRISFNITALGRTPFERSHLMRGAWIFHHHDTLRAQMNDIMRTLDLGLSRVDIVQHQRETPQGEAEAFYLPLGIHEASDRSGHFELPFHEESSGTQAAFVLLSRVLGVLEGGGVAVIDELDNDLHPHMLPRILDLFKFEHTNPHHAQLIFSCHTPEVLDLLKKHQVYLVEKRDLHSTAWRLDDMVGLRADDNLYAKYQAGALGGTPDL